MISAAARAALRSRVAGAKAARLARHYAGRRAAYVSDLAAHAAAILDSPLDNTANLTFADHLLEAHPDHPAAEAFRRFVTEGEPLMSMRDHIAGSDWRAAGPHEGAPAPYLELRRVPPRPGATVHRDLTPELMASPVFRRVAGEPGWRVRRYLDRGIMRGLEPLDAGSTAPTRRRPLSSAEVAQHVYETGGVPSLLHAIIGARYFHPERTDTPPHRTRERGADYRFARAVRYAASHADLPHLFAAIHPSVWRGDTYHDVLPRLTTADALDEVGRHDEAKLMRSRVDGSDDPTKPLLPVYLDNGVVRPVAALRAEMEDGAEHFPGPYPMTARPGARHLRPEDRDYLTSALWSSMDDRDPTGHLADDAQPLDANYGIGDIHPATLAQMVADNRLFHSLHGHLIGDATDESGHHFWLSRNGHGTGFFDHPENYGEHTRELQDAAHRFGGYDLSVGDDGMIHGPTHGDERPDPRDEGLGPDDPNYTGGLGGAHYTRQARVLRYAMEVSHQDIAGFHRAIHDHPGEDLPHLAYADMLEESGHPAEAAVIRNAIRDHVTFWGRPRRGFEADPYYQAWYGNEPDMTPEDHEFHSGPRLRPGEFSPSYTDEHGVDRGVQTHHQIVRLVQRSAAEPDRRMVWEARVPYPEGQNLVQQIRAAGQPADPGEGPWAETPTPQNYPPPEEDAAHLARRYAAYRAPVGGVVVRGLAYKGGQLIPDLKTFLPPEKLDRLKARARKRPKKVVDSRAQAYERARRYTMEGDPTEHAAFQRAILADPHDLTPRRVYADYLDETGTGAPGAAETLRNHTGQAVESVDIGRGGFHRVVPNAIAVRHGDDGRVHVDFTRTVRPGSARMHRNKQPVSVNIEYVNGRLSLTGSHGRGSGGQIDMRFKHRSPADDDPRTTNPIGVHEFRFYPGWDANKWLDLLDVWNRWHLNDMKAGSPAQEQFLRANPVNTVAPESHYDKATQALEAAGLNPDPETGYRYGSKRLREEVPGDVLEFLNKLPEAS